ncbi:glycosyltransferase family 2 protein [Antarctobacter jejuensis]|uniref:glycosyltransferase family 2 protein n=1 Tax=Antarctobacter jejuensis TaxID=1439938 RepID=UPI003FD0CBCE
MTALSVVIPAFRPQGFTALTRSMSANADVDAEWIVVDDGSGTKYDAVFATLPEGVQLIRLPQNRRQAAARNAGLAQAQGQWIKFLDADDELDAGHLAALLERTGQQDMAIPFAPTKHVFANGTTHVNDSWRDLPADSAAQYRRQIVRPFLHHCGALYPRDLVTRLGGYDESLITDEDGDLLLRILHAGHYFVPVEGVHYLYVHHDGGPRVSADDDIAKMQARIRACDKVAERFDGRMPPDLANALAQRMDKIAMTYWTAFPAEAKALIARARRVSPDYTPDMRGPLRLLRGIGGPGMVLAAQGLYRRLKGRPKGGAQG